VIRRVRVWDGTTMTDGGRESLVAGRSLMVPPYKWKGGDSRPLYRRARSATVSCRPSSSRPWLSLPLSVIPPFMWDDLRERPTALVAAAWHAQRAAALAFRFEARRRRASHGSQELAWVGRPHTRY